MSDFVLAVHGGAGDYEAGQFSTTEQRAYRTALTESLTAGAAILEADGNSVDAVVAAITCLEDCPLFNAAHGSVFNAQGTIDLDASIMEGTGRNAGAIAGVQQVRNPIVLARTVMDKSQHVMLQGEGAEIYARLHDLPLVENHYFHTPERLAQLHAAQARGSVVTLSKYGTVGAVARDRQGRLAAGTSTGGLTNKRFGRVGDSPIIGAGTYADDRSCAVSATGHGEFFIRATVARSIAAHMEFASASLAQAAHQMVYMTLKTMGGQGGVIAVDQDGNVVFEFNTKGLFRGMMREHALPHTGILRDDVQPFHPKP